MFTGIVETVGQVVEWRAGHLGVRSQLAPRLEVGASIAVNGACLTVVAVEGDAFFADVVPETRRRTNIGLAAPGDRVNLELPLRADRSLDGHLVQGHVDGTARVTAVAEVEMGREVEFELPPDLAPYVAEKGSIAVDGVSLTVTRVGERPDTFGVALIPHTLDRTIAGQYVPGTLVNVEVDVVARYVARLMGRPAATEAQSR
jgi:riboflavin synthase